MTTRETQEQVHKGRYEIALDCVHCGLCLPVCPTYLHLGEEADSPRGRIYLMRAHEEGRQPITPGFMKHLDLCLVCRACETACPSGVEFGTMMEEFRALVRPEAEKEMATSSPATRLRAWLGRSVLLHVLPYRRRLRVLVNMLWLYQKSGVSKLARRLGLLRALGIETQESLCPTIPPASTRRAWPASLPALGTRRARVLLLRGCVAPELLPAVQEATLAVLRRNGCEVLTPATQTCCGALHFHSGYREQGLDLLEHNVGAFDLRDIDALVVNAAGCGSTLKDYGHLGRERPRVTQAAASLAARVRDVSEFLHELGVEPGTEEVRGRVVYDEPCHLLHGQGISKAPQALLGAVPGLEVVPLRDADRCCGSAGIYNVLHPELAGDILAEKIRNIEASGADFVATGNPGCILQIQNGLRTAAQHEPRLAGVEVVHPVQLLARAYGMTGGSQPSG